jgi:uncharacterized membrane protein
VGFYLDENLVGHGYLWQDGFFTTIDHPDAVANTATFELNNRGEIVGFHDSFDGKRSFVLRRGEFTSINVPGALDTSALGISDRGNVVGEHELPGGVLAGFLATKHANIKLMSN